MGMNQERSLPLPRLSQEVGGHPQQAENPTRVLEIVVAGDPLDDDAQGVGV